MKDFLGRELEIGDRVVIEEPRYRNFIKAKVVAFTPQQVRLEYFKKSTGKEYPYEYLTPPTHVIKIIKED